MSDASRESGEQAPTPGEPIADGTAAGGDPAEEAAEGTVERWLRYWRQSLADADLPSPVLQPRSILELDPIELEDGELSPLVAARLFERAGRPPPDDEDDDDPPIPLRIAVLRLRRLVRHGKAIELDHAHHAPLWVAARLLRTGRLLAPEGQAPAWLARRYLEPVTAVGPAVGTVDAMDEFLTRHPGPDGGGWSELWEFSESLFETVTGRAQALYEPEGYRRFGPVVDLRPHRPGAGDALLQLVDRLLERGALDADDALSLLRRLVTGGDAEVVAPADRAVDLAAARRHLGQMTGRFALGPAQRRALHAALRLAPGKLLAVNGPPGTGKTTLVQSLLASAWIGRALRDAEPPLVVVCSTNNRAITNVLDSFAAVDDAGDSLTFGRRWLPDLPSYGLYLPAKSRALDDEGRYAVARAEGSDWSGLPQQIETPGYVARARASFLQAASEAFGSRCADPDEALDKLRDALKTAVDRLRTLLETAESLDRERNRDADPEPALAAVENALRELAADEETLHALRDQVDEVLRRRSLWSDLLSFVPPVRARRIDDLATVFERHGALFERSETPRPRLTGRSDQASVRASLRTLADEHVARRQDLASQREVLAARRDAERTWRRELEALAEPLDDGAALVERIVETPSAIAELLDRTLRRRLFFLAGRYWEGRWLLAADELLARGPAARTRQSRRAVVERFRRWSMLTPVMVATLFRMPRIFDYYDGLSAPLFDTIDLLIVDEAGQVAPEVGAPVFALARRSVIVGDVHQLEPIWNVSQGIDHANLRDHDLDPEALEDEAEGPGLKASEGNLMRIARRATYMSDPPRHASAPTDGIWLREHRRSVPAIVRFCNRLVYRGLLEACRPALDRTHHPLPAFGFGHVSSPSEQDGSSRRNLGQAEALADWLARRREELEAWYRRPLDEIVAVITPYVGQIQPLIDALRRHELPTARTDDAPGISVGTVHTFQGGERPIVLFSPAIVRGDSTYFLDRGPNLLNVAVSRARDAFVLFGQLDAFNRERSTPTGILAQHLLEDPSHELVDVLAAPHLRSAPGVVAVASHEEHRALLRRALADAHKRLLLCSPYLTHGALDADDIPGLITAARRRKVRVVVAHSPDLSHWPTDEPEGRLRAAGADVLRLTRHHAKTLAVDDHLYVEGSYNWLSAARDTDHPHHYTERSLAVEGRSAEAPIKNLWRSLRTLSSSR